MLSYWNDPFGSFDWMEDLRRRMERAFDADRQREGSYRGSPWDALSSGAYSAGVPRMSFHDSANEILFIAEVPGIAQEHVNVSLEGDTLTISGQRPDDAPAGYKVHRRERAPVHFTRVFTLPCRVDAEHAKAELKDGILTLHLPKAAEARPRQISVNAA
jgi:HSP20 family protein